MEEGGREVIANGYGVSFWGDESILELDSDDKCTTLWKKTQIIYFSRVNFMACEFYFFQVKINDKYAHKHIIYT